MIYIYIIIFIYLLYFTINIIYIMSFFLGHLENNNNIKKNIESDECKKNIQKLYRKKKS
jgi:hypothetical protein